MSRTEVNFSGDELDTSFPDYPDTGDLDDMGGDLGSSEEALDSVEHGEEDAPDPFATGPSAMAPKVGGMSQTVSELLQQRWSAWKEVKGNKKKTVWRNIANELRGLPEHKGLPLEQWGIRLKTYLKWMHKQGRTHKKKTTFFAEPTWTLRRVVVHYKKARINQILEDEYGVILGTPEMVRNYQAATTDAIEELTPSQQERAAQIAQDWNENSPPDSVKSVFAEQGVGKIVQQFAEEMWKRGRVRMVVLTGWKDEKKGLFSNVFDFNQAIDDGPCFQGTGDFEGQWDQYIRQAFMEDSGDVGPDNVQESGPVEQRSKQPRKPRSNAAVERVTSDDGTIWIPELRQCNRTDLQDLVRGFLTAHYRQATRNPKASAPFKKLHEWQDDLFLEHHLPTNFNFPDDPSHFKVGEAKRFLEFIRERQKNCPEDVFAFRYTLNRLEELVEPVDTSDEEDEARRVQESKRAKKPAKSRYMDVEDDEAEEHPDKLPNRNQPRAVRPRDATEAHPRTRDADDDAEGSEAELELDADIHANAGNDRPRHSDEDTSDIDEEVRRKYLKGKGKEVEGKKQAQPSGPASTFRRGQVPSMQTEDGPSSRGSGAENQPRHNDTSGQPGKEVTFSTVGPAHSNEESGNSAPNANSGRPTAIKPAKKPAEGTSALPENPQLQRKDKVGPPRGVKRAKEPIKGKSTLIDSVPRDQPENSQLKQNDKVGPPRGVKRSKEPKSGAPIEAKRAKASSTPNANSALGDTNAGTQLDSEPEDRSHRAYRPVPVVYNADQLNPELSAPRNTKKQPIKLKSALKASTVQKPNATQEAVEHQGSAAGESRNQHLSDQSSDRVRVTPKRPPRPRDGDQQPDGEGDLDPITPRRSIRARRTPARDDEEVPHRKRPAESLPIIRATKKMRRK